MKELELYFERLEKAGLGRSKRPDVLIFARSAQDRVDTLVRKIGGLSELPFTPEDNKSVTDLLQMAILAVECENSLWKGRNMPDYGSELRPRKWLGGKPGLKKGAVVPTLILKEEDRKPLQAWQDANFIPVHIWHIFYDVAFGISLDRAQELIKQGLILPNTHRFQAPSGATTEKVIYKIYYHYAYGVGNTTQEPELKAKFIEDKNGHILPYIHFEGGRMDLSTDALQMLRDRANAKT
ncbi:AccI family restriction endonuclease [Candidatus Roseilinea sp. NK_OTU-006]|uniref:AccI family restriction endonuclease n=1 Tax=Candidatus Roseilinea sp. NK_OTU-006 TaxID=2704250 RepID=UPI001F0ABF89|nr:AccI family restriction endonuclease [Candidatus Roseilinea sp. NK_OTU-006]